MTGFLVVLFGYVLAATYAVKLIPLYGGYEGRTSLRAVTMLYADRLRMLAANLDTVTLAPAEVVCVLAGIIIVLAVSQQIVLILCMLERKDIQALPDRRHNDSA